MHRLMTNTLPEPILAALGGGDTACVRVYPGTTVLQADMVGFPRLDQDSSMTCPRTPPPQADMVGFTKLSAASQPSEVSVYRRHGNDRNDMEACVDRDIVRTRQGCR